MLARARARPTYLEGETESLSLPSCTSGISGFSLGKGPRGYVFDNGGDTPTLCE